jgi:hypothetical protein
MSRTTGPILVAGSLTWANQTILADGTDTSVALTEGIRIGVATGVLAAVFFGLEKVSSDAATGLAYVLLATSLVVRFNNKPNALERVLELVD